MFKFVSLILLLVSMMACSEATSQTDYNFKAPKENGVVANAVGITISEEEFNKDIENEVYRKQLEIHDIKMNQLRSLLVKKLIKADPKSKGITNDQYLEKYIVSKIKVTKKEIEAFYEQQKVPESQRKNARIKERVKQMITAQKKKQALEKWLADKTKKTGVDVYFKKPKAPVYDVKVGNSPFTGAKNAKVTIVEFSDFQCPYCAKAAAVLKKVKEKYKSKVKIVFKHFPLSFHRHAKPAALASMCAHEQEPAAFWKMHDKFFFDKVPMNSDKIIQMATKDLKLNAKKFLKCYQNKKYAALIERNIQQGKSLNVNSTPTVYINGQLFVDTLSFEKYVSKIDDELK